MSLRQAFLGLLLLAKWAPSSSVVLQSSHDTLQADKDVKNLQRISKSGQQMPEDLAQYLRTVPTNSCPCLPWPYAYNGKFVDCGRGTHFLDGSDENSCDFLFKKMPDAKCINYQMGDPLGQWCYVDSECSGITRRDQDGYVNTQVSWKRCTPENDEMTSEMTVANLLSYAKANDIMSTLLLKMAYPVYLNKSSSWSEEISSDQLTISWSDEIKPLIDQGADSIELASFPESMRSGIKDAIESGKPVIIDGGDTDGKPGHGAPPFAVLEGHKIYEARAEQIHDYNWRDHPSLLSSVSLYKGS